MRSALAIDLMRDPGAAIARSRLRCWAGVAPEASDGRSLDHEGGGHTLRGRPARGQRSVFWIA
jgi:hypothetical protein